MKVNIQSKHRFRARRKKRRPASPAAHTSTITKKPNALNARVVTERATRRVESVRGLVFV